MNGFRGLAGFAKNGGKFYLLKVQKMLFRLQFPGCMARKNLGRLPGDPAQQVALISATTRQGSDFR